MSFVTGKTKHLSGFKSYIDNASGYDERGIDVPPEPEAKDLPFLLPREAVVAEAKNVLKFASLKGNEGISGTLFITNFKISFVTSSSPVDTKECELHRSSLQNDFLGLYDVCLTEIDVVQYLSEGSRKKRLQLSSLLSSRILEIHLILKNCRTINFHFRFTPADEVYKLAKALMIYKFPNSVNLLYFAWNSPPPFTGIPEYKAPEDWEKELKRTKCTQWRVSQHNEFHNIFSSLPDSFVIPQGLTDIQLEKAANFFRGNRPPVWCWGTRTGAALVRMAQLSLDVQTSKIENEMIKHIHLAHPIKKPPTIYDLDQELPSLKTIQQSYVKLRTLHTPDSKETFLENEKSYLAKWHSTGWLPIVTQCLEVTELAVAAITVKNSTVILQENEGRDLSCVISSLIQLILDPYARTFRGFHSLIQKEWISLGHPFSTRFGRTRQHPDEQSPVWLLFLDCVHQICIMHPSALEFTDDYLVALWQASHCSLLSTALFDCHKDKHAALQDFKKESRLKEAYLWPIWSWWGCTEGQRTQLQRQELKKQTDLFNRRCTDIKKRQSLIPDSVNIKMKSPEELNLILRKRDLKVVEEKVSELEKLCKSDTHFRKSVREKFVNVFYLQYLLEVILAPSSLRRLRDPVANTNRAWHRLYHLVGKSVSSLPYDPTLPQPPLELDRPLILASNFRCQPWTSCFASWLPDSIQPSGESKRTVSNPTIGDRDSHWTCVKEIVSLLEDLFSSSTLNGSCS